MEVKNDTDYDLYLHIDKLAEILIRPHTTKPLTVQSGTFHFNAAVSGYPPNFGYIAFFSGNEYPWRFFISHAHEHDQQSLVTPQMIADYNAKLADVNTKQAEIKIEKQQIDDARSALQKQDDKVKAESNDIDTRRVALDHSDEKAVADFNLLVVTENNDLDSYNKMNSDFNARIIAYNSYLDAWKAEKQQLDALGDTINASH